MSQETKNQKSIWQKLMETQRVNVSLAKTEGSGTKSSYDSSKASYSYPLPGREIVEAIRKMMDERDMMMPMNVVNGEIYSFQ